MTMIGYSMMEEAKKEIPLSILIFSLEYLHRTSMFYRTDAEVMFITGLTMTPVSYTHLAVYKRQGRSVVIRPRAAASAKLPPEPMAATSCSGSSTSPAPVMT